MAGALVSGSGMYANAETSLNCVLPATARPR